MLLLKKPKEDKIRRFIELQRENEAKLQQFIEFFEFAIYKLSWILNYNKNPVGGNNHTHGGVIDLLNHIRVDRQAYDKWVLEAEHGFLHGFCTLYMAYCLSPDKDALWEDLKWYERHIDRGRPRFTPTDNLIVSCLLHDFMRFIYTDPIGHDKKLIELTDKLLPETYQHANPVEESILVAADRLELLRYTDHASWVETQRLEKHAKTYGGWDLLNHFYNHIRPVIEKLFTGRNDVWFSHALEVLAHPIWQSTDKKDIPSEVEDNLGVPYYPKFHWKPVDEGYKAHMKPEYEKYFSVHSGRLPFANCIEHTKGYYRAQAIINLETVKKYGCDVTCAPPSTGGRDHLFIVQHQKLPTKEWCFLYEFGTNHENQFRQIELNDLCTITAKLFTHIHRSTEMFLINMLCLCCK